MHPMISVSRRAFLVGTATAGIWMRARIASAGIAPTDGDAWFWNIVGQIEAGPPVGGPSAGDIDNSTFGVEAHRAGRENPHGTPPALADFYLRAVFEPDTTDGRDWDIGFVWRTSSAMDALWWTIETNGTWSLNGCIWERTARAPQVLASDGTCGRLDSPVLLQALVAGSRMACSVNHGDVIHARIPDRRDAGHVGILANAQDPHLRPSGVTPYRELAVWSLDRADLSALPDKIPRSLC
jgi:hypothetical protein